MKKYIPLLVIVLVLLAGAVIFMNNKKSSLVQPNTDTTTTQKLNNGDVANEKIEKLSDDWSRYTNTRTHISFEFPSLLSLEPEGFNSYSNDVPSTRLTNRGNVANTKITSAIIMPTNASEMTSVDAWKKFINSDETLNKNLKYEMVDGVNIAVSSVSPQGNTDGYIEVLFFRNNQSNNISINGLPVTTTDHIVKSLHFF